MGKIAGWSKHKDLPRYIIWKRDVDGKEGIPDVVTVEYHPDGVWRRYASTEKGDFVTDHSTKQAAYRSAISYMRRNP